MKAGYNLIILDCWPWHATVHILQKTSGLLWTVRHFSLLLIIGWERFNAKQGETLDLDRNWELEKYATCLLLWCVKPQWWLASWKHWWAILGRLIRSTEWSFSTGTWNMSLTTLCRLSIYQPEPEQSTCDIYWSPSCIWTTVHCSLCLSGWAKKVGRGRAWANRM